MDEGVSAGGTNVKALYQDRLRSFEEARDRERATGLRLGWIRVGVFLTAFALYVVQDVAEGAPAWWARAGMLLAILVFVVLVVKHRRVRARERWMGHLAEVNRTALARLDRDWDTLPPIALAPVARTHPYALDLDVCGEASLFRLLTTPTIPPGRATLRAWLLGPAYPEEIRRRQTAVEELAPRLEERQTLEATGRMVDSPDPEAMKAFMGWAEARPWLAGRPWLVAGARIFPLLSAGLLWFQFWGPLSRPWWIFTMAAAFVVANRHKKRIHALMDEASGGQERFGRYAALLGRLMEMEVRAPILQELQEAVRSSPVGAVRELRRLERLAGWADVRLNTMVHQPFQALLAWDIHVLERLERWKEGSGPHVRRWLEALGTLEALGALAALKGDHPDWSFPILDEDGAPGLRVSGMGHPLLPPSRCVVNDVEVGPPGSFLFVTGSNMSGKSTLLRAVGVNTVLAQAGGPVFASHMRLTPLAVETSMRTTDSLSEGVSQYMAELRRIQQVVEGARQEPRVLYLLDEPLQGTNEAERRVAVQTILGHLLDAGAVGAVATHDLGLDGTPRLGEAARAVHLEGQVRDGDTGPLLSFDYRLRPGRATSTNALALLRAVGLGERDALP